MSEKFTIKIPREDGERHNERRKDLGQTWLEYIDGQAPTMPTGGEVDTERIEAALATIEERTGKLERMVEEMQR